MQSKTGNRFGEVALPRSRFSSSGLTPTLYPCAIHAIGVNYDGM
jgi:hypothetical protein